MKWIESPLTVMATLALILLGPLDARGAGQKKLADAKSLRCTFSLNTAGTWKKNGEPEAAAKPASLILVFESIDTDDGTAKLRSGTMTSDIIARSSPGYLHFIQSFRGPLYTTTVFDQETAAGKLKAVHSRHESFSVPLPGATSSPEQYYGECEITN
jgi:hypothetical protein